MGDVIVTYRIMPEDPKELENIRKELEKLKPQKLEEEPIAFGLSAFKFIKIIPDAEGEIDKLEKELKGIKGVQDIENIGVTRSL